MLRVRLVAAALAATLFNGAPSAISATFTTADAQAIHRARAQRSAGIASKDAQAAAAIATPDHVMMPPMAPILEGREPLRSFFAGPNWANVKSLEFTSLDLQGSGELAYDRGAYVLTGTDGSQLRGKYLWVWRRQADGSWRVAIAMWSPDQP